VRTNSLNVGVQKYVVPHEFVLLHCQTIGNPQGNANTCSVRAGRTGDQPSDERSEPTPPPSNCRGKQTVTAVQLRSKELKTPPPPSYCFASDLNSHELLPRDTESIVAERFDGTFESAAS
jgi:hypothetical protein